jgi:hypothetical protein
VKKRRRVKTRHPPNASEAAPDGALRTQRPRSFASLAARSCASFAVVAPAESIFLDTSSSLRVCSAATRQQSVGRSVVFLLQHRTTMLQSASGHLQVTSSSLPTPSHELNHLLIVCDFGIGYVAQRQEFPGEYAKSPHVAASARWQLARKFVSRPSPRGPAEFWVGCHRYCTYLYYWRHRFCTYLYYWFPGGVATQI